MLHPGKKILFIILCVLVQLAAVAQTIAGRLSAAFSLLEKDPQLEAGFASICVVDAKTGQLVFEKNSRTGMATASTLKIITSVTAYEMLGKDFRYTTQFGYSGSLQNGELKGDLIIRAAGDPTLGSWRWQGTSEDKLWQRLVSSYKKAGVRSFDGLKVETTGWEEEIIPDGWTWGDIGNYYGAGAAGFNWRENQYDILLKSGNDIGSAVSVVETLPRDLSFTVHSLVRSAAKGTGDNSYVYYPLQQPNAVVRGTIPVNESRFKISASMPDARKEFARFFFQRLAAAGIRQVKTGTSLKNETILHTETSPPLDSIIYWFNKKSVNLYGEALVKTIAFSKTGKGSTDEGLKIFRKFWQTTGLGENELVMVDGSGLSPENRVTTHALSYVLAYAKKQPWFNGFYQALPEYNGMKLKSGTIKGAKGFAGYHTSREGREYIVSFLVNNYNGSSGTLVQKMYKVLDVLK